LVDCISSFGFGENNKNHYTASLKPDIRALLRPDFAFPQIESRLGVVTLFPLPLRPEKQV
jgi:hypothetical protein